MKALCKGQKKESIPKEKIFTQREWRHYLNQAIRKNPIIEGYKYFECLQESPDSTYSAVAEKFNISKARVCQMIALVIRLPREIIDFIVDKNDPQFLSHFTERKLRPLTLLEFDEEKVDRFKEMVESCSEKN
ncbi:MAG: hypothetical protein ACMUJM_04090 [bacterium]